MGKDKAVPLQAWSGPEGSRKLRFPDFFTRVRMVVRLSALCTVRLYPKETNRNEYQEYFLSVKAAGA